MSRKLKKRMSPSDTVIVWSAAVVALVAAIILDKGSAPHKWHAAIMWTGVAFYGLLVFGRRKWTSGPFWIFWAACLVLHAISTPQGVKNDVQWRQEWCEKVGLGFTLVPPMLPK